MRKKIEGLELTAAQDLAAAGEHSYVGKAALEALKKDHFRLKGICWNKSCGKVIGDLQQTPSKKFWDTPTVDPGVSNSFPAKMGEVMKRGKTWVDLTSLSPPDGIFLEKIKDAIATLAGSENPIIVRLLFGNIVGMPVDCDDLIASLTEGLDPSTSNISLWVGAWRKGVSWNHSKIIAVDGQHLFTGGHNLWDPHYLQQDPVHDVSMELEGPVAGDGHLFADYMWDFIIRHDWGEAGISHWIPDGLPLVVPTRVGIANWPPDACDEHPPLFQNEFRNPKVWEWGALGKPLPMISMGRYGNAHDHHIRKGFKANPSDSAITAMFRSAKKIIRMSLQDLGPLTLPIPGSNISIPGGVWPHDYLEALAERLGEGVDIEIVLSNPHAVPGGLSPLTANYGNGWVCEDVASEIIQKLAQTLSGAKEGGGCCHCCAHDDDFELTDEQTEYLRDMVHENLRVSFLRCGGKDKWDDDATKGNHAKFFMVDDRCYYVGSQNLYIANLAEWGVVIDDEAQTQKILAEYWNPMWKQSYKKEDCDVDKVMDELHVDRDGGKSAKHTAEMHGLDHEEVTRGLLQSHRASMNTHDTDAHGRVMMHEEVGNLHGVDHDEAALAYAPDHYG